MQITLNVEGMSCEHCEKAVQTAVLELAGVSHVKADSEKNQVYVEFDSSKVDAEKIKSAIDDIGYSVLE